MAELKKYRQRRLAEAADALEALERDMHRVLGHCPVCDAYTSTDLDAVAAVLRLREIIEQLNRWTEAPWTRE